MTSLTLHLSRIPVIAIVAALLAGCAGGIRNPASGPARPLCHGPACCADEDALRFEPHRLNCRAIAQRQAGQRQVAAETLDAAIRAAEAVRTGNAVAANEVLCYALNEQADNAAQQGDWPRAERLSLGNREACDARFGAGSSESTQAHYGYANLLLNRNHLDRAEPEFNTVIANSRRLGLRGLESFSLDALGRIADIRGDVRTARPLLQQAIDLKREVFGDNSAELAVSYTNLGASYSAAGDFRTGIGWYLLAAANYRATFGPLAARTIGVETALATSYMTIGELQNAERWYLDLIPRATEVYGADSLPVNDLRNDYGVVLTKARRYPEALAQFNAALEVRRQQQPGTSLHGYSALNSARIQREIGGCDSARELRSEVRRVVAALKAAPATMDDEARAFVNDAASFEQSCAGKR